MKKFRLWNENGLDHIIETNATKKEFKETINHVKKHVPDYDNESVVEKLREKGFQVNEEHIEEENSFYW